MSTSSLPQMAVECSMPLSHLCPTPSQGLSLLSFTERAIKYTQVRPVCACHSCFPLTQYAERATAVDH